MRRVPRPDQDAIRQEYKRLLKAHVEHLTKTKPNLKPSTIYNYAKRAATAGKWPPGYSRIPPIELVDVTTQPPPPLYDSDALCGSQGHPEVQDIVPEEVATEYMALPYSPPLFSYQDANSNPVAELASRELCRRRLLPFIKRFRPKYTAGWFHADICRRVERFVERVERMESPRLLLMAPPRSGKSEILSRNTPAWIIGKHPEWELIAASYAGALTMTFSRYIRDLLRDPAYQALYPTTKLDPSSQSVEAWNTTRGGMYAAVGQGGPITGKGAHVFLVDDIVKDHEAAQSLSQRESTWAWWTSTAYTRLAPGGGVLALMTNWHADDWAGRIQETMTLGGEVYEVIKYPAINDYGDEYILPDDSIIQIADKEPVPQGALMTRPKNTAIHPERYDTQHMLRIKNNLEMSGQKAVWNALYQQNPVPDEGSFFQKDMFRYYSTPPARRDMYIYQAWDFAISTGKENDFTIGITIGVDHRDAVYVLDMRRFRSGDGIEIAQTILEYSIEWGTNAIGVEDGQIWKAIETQFLKACEEHPSRHFPSYEQLKPLTDKKVRADPLRGRMQAGKVYFDKEAHYFSVMQNELLHFPNAKHDDCHTYTTLVECRHGQVMIGRLRDGDEILSYDGVDVVVGKVSQHHCTGVKEVIEITFSDGVTLELTPSHPVLTARGYVYAGDLTTHDDVVRRDVCRYRNTASNGQKSLPATTSPPQTSTELGDGCTATPMSRSEDLSRTGTTSTTSMATKTTTTCVTSSACQASGTGRNTAQTWWCSVIHHSSSIISQLSDSLPWLRKQVSMSARASCESACRESAPVQSAARSSRQLLPATTPLRTVLQSALTKSEMYIQRLLTKLRQHARTANSPSYLVATPSDENCIAQQPVGTNTSTKIDISRESAHRVGIATISGKVTHQCSVESVLSQEHPSTDTSAHAAGRRFYPESKMDRYSAIESVLTSTEDLDVMQRASTDSNRQFVKVVSVRRIGYHETYNFEVDRTRNFLVQGGIVVHNCVDSLAWAVRLTLTRTPPREPKQPQQKSWRDKLKAHLVGARGGGTHMSA